MAIEDLVTNAVALVAVFGRWPSFHDAEVRSVLLESESDYSSCRITTLIYVFDLSGETDQQGHFQLDHETVVKLRFHNIENFDGGDRDGQNVLFGLYIKEITSREGRMQFDVTFDSAARDIWFSATFKCRKIEVVPVEPLR